MSNIKNALTEIQRISQMFKAFKEVENVLKVAQSAEQVLNETKKATDVAKEQRQIEEIELTKTKNQVKSAKAKADEIISVGKQEASDLIEDANQKISTRLDKLEADQAKFNSDKSFQQNKLKGLNADIEESKKVLAAWHKDIATAKHTIAKLKAI